jgi:ABC-type uncharacterized transport system auxiliary subunit
VKNRILYVCGVFAAALFLAACSTPQPAADAYIIAPKIAISQMQQSKYRDAIVKVRPLYGKNSLFSRDMYYVEDNAKQFKYSQSQWALPPESMLEQKVMEMLIATKVFGFVQSASSKVAAAYVLETRVNDFKQYFEEHEHKSYVHVSISFSLISSKTHGIIMSKTFEKRVKVQELNAAGGVKALNQALKDVLEDAALWIKESSR